MEQAIIKNLSNCQALDDLAEVWREVVPVIENMPDDQAMEIIQLKDDRKTELENGIFRRRMESNIMGTVDVIFDTHKPDQAKINGAVYTRDELKDLLSRNLVADDLLMIHRVKQKFEGTVNP